jgi:hypothetical protein
MLVSANQRFSALTVEIHRKYYKHSYLTGRAEDFRKRGKMAGV